MSYKYYDNTRVSTAKNCMRQYYLRHVRDWRRDGNAPALAFGSSWHEAMDVVWSMASGPASDADIREAAMVKFDAKWVEEGFKSRDELTPADITYLGARTPGVAAEMLHNYIKMRRPFLADIELLAVELPFAVPLFPDNPNILYIGRYDKVFRYNGQVYLGEHKTTSSYKKDGPFRDDYLESYSPNSQVDGYMYSAHLKYGDELAGIWIDAALVHKTVHNGFKFIPINRKFNMLSSWLYETRFWVNTIQAQDQELINKDHDDYLAAFPKNTGACNHYAGCTYRDICRMIANPHKEANPPMGYIEDHWEPFDVLGLEKIGLKPE